jgi:hypothetical protein
VPAAVFSVLGVWTILSGVTAVVVGKTIRRGDLVPVPVRVRQRPSVIDLRPPR